MTEHIKQQVSQFIDDELSGDECEFFVRRLQHDGASRHLYMRYHAIGAAIRGEHVAAAHTSLRDRVRDALDPETQPVPAPETSWLGSRVARVVAGFGVAAGVAVIAFVTLPAGNELDYVAPAHTVFETEQTLERLDPPSDVMPLQFPGRQAAAPEVRLTSLQYLMHHSGHASSLSRTALHTNMLAADNPDIVAAAAEVGRR